MGISYLNFKIFVKYINFTKITLFAILAWHVHPVAHLSYGKLLCLDQQTLKSMRNTNYLMLQILNNAIGHHVRLSWMTGLFLSTFRTTPWNWVRFRQRGLHTSGKRYLALQESAAFMLWEKRSGKLMNLSFLLQHLCSWNPHPLRQRLHSQHPDSVPSEAGPGSSVSLGPERR